MALTLARKVLGQLAPTAGITSLQDIYTVPASTFAIISTAIVTNTGGADATIRIAIAVNGAATINRQYIYHTLLIPANESFAFTLGLTIDAADVVRISTDIATVSISLFGIETTGNTSAQTYKVLDQSTPLATTLTDGYVVPAARQGMISTGMICNRGAGTVKVRISVAPAGAADNISQYIYYDLSIPGNETFVFTFAIMLAATDVVRYYTDTQTVSFNLFGSELL